MLLATVPIGTWAKDKEADAGPQGGDGEAVTLEVRIIRASNEGGGVDQSLQDLRDRFARFSWTSYRLVSTRTIRLGPGAEGSVALPNGDVFRMRDMTLGGGRARMTVGTAAVVLKVSLADDGTVVVGGLKEAGGESELMVAVTADF
jgi:hypothetical protein